MIEDKKMQLARWFTIPGIFLLAACTTATNIDAETVGPGYVLYGKNSPNHIFLKVFNKDQKVGLCGAFVGWGSEENMEKYYSSP